MFNAILGFLAAIIGYLFLQNRSLKKDEGGKELQTEKEKLNDAQEKTDAARDSYNDIYKRYRDDSDNDNGK